ncbi:MAG: hypothetical protein R3F19_21490 [Verrucomicrobiales bacterium]
MDNPNLLFAGLCLFGAIFMFTALKFPVLMGIFRLKGVDAEANRTLSRTIGKVLAPVMGVAFLLSAVYFVLEWKAYDKRAASFSFEIENRTKVLLDEAKESLAKGKIQSIYRRDRSVPSAEDAKTIEALLHEIGISLSVEHFQMDRHETRKDKNAWFVAIAPPNSEQFRGIVQLFPDSGEIKMMGDAAKYLIPTADKYHNLASVGAHITVPDEFRSRFTALGDVAASEETH